MLMLFSSTNNKIVFSLVPSISIVEKFEHRSSLCASFGKNIINNIYIMWEQKYGAGKALGYKVKIYIKKSIIKNINNRN